MPKKKRTTKKRTTTKVTKAGTMSINQLVSELAKALQGPLDSNERRTFTVRVATAKQKRKSTRR